ncbi:MAG: hypothetical protein HYU64_21560 [Armatimonadetes bacterium]|nr:hypothetical protein [Armatimonadota bacterium]
MGGKEESFQYLKETERRLILIMIDEFKCRGWSSSFLYADFRQLDS